MTQLLNNPAVLVLIFGYLTISMGTLPGIYAVFCYFVGGFRRTLLF